MADEIQGQLNKNDIVHLTKKVDEGFKGTHKRLDTLNGQVAKNTNWRYYITGGLAVLTIMVIPILISIIKETLANK